MIDEQNENITESNLPEEESGLNIIATPDNTDVPSNAASNEIVMEEKPVSTEDNLEQNLADNQEPIEQPSTEDNLSSDGVSTENNPDDSEQTSSNTKDSTTESSDDKSPIAEEQVSEETVEQPILSPMEQVMSELSDLYPPKDSEVDEKTTPEEIKPKVVDNVDDSEELADEVGVSNIFDTYGREILEPVFENILRMSINNIKLAYSKLKNTILSYKQMTQRFEGDHELFRFDTKLLFKFEIKGNALFFYVYTEDQPDPEIYHYDVLLDEENKQIAIIFRVETITEELYGKLTPFDKVVGYVDKVMESLNNPKRTVYVPVAYAERYLVNPQAVLRGKEKIAPIDGQYDFEEYDPIMGELVRNIIDELLGKDFDVNKKQGKEHLEALRLQSETIKDAVAITEPIVYFYDAALNADSSCAFINVQQVLNDKFLGKMLPQQYTAIAENSDKIEDLNFFTLNEVLQNCIDNEKLRFVFALSCKILAKKKSLDKLTKLIAKAPGNLIIALNCSMLEALGKVGLDGINAIHNAGAEVMLDGIENVSLKLLTEYPIEYLRFDARYFPESEQKRATFLDMIVGYANVQAIPTIAMYVDTIKEVQFFLKHNVGIIQGYAACEPKRQIHAAVKGAKKLPKV